MVSVAPPPQGVQVSCHAFFHEKWEPGVKCQQSPCGVADPKAEACRKPTYRDGVTRAGA